MTGQENLERPLKQSIGVNPLAGIGPVRIHEVEERFFSDPSLPINTPTISDTLSHQPLFPDADF